MDACTHIHRELKVLFIKETFARVYTVTVTHILSKRTGPEIQNCRNLLPKCRILYKTLFENPVLKIKIMHFSFKRVYFCLSLCFHLHTSSFSCSNLKLCKLNLLGTWFNSEKLPWDKYWLFTKKFTSVLTVSALSQ